METGKNKKQISIPSKYLNVAGVISFLLIISVGYLLIDNVSRTVEAKRLSGEEKKQELALRSINIQKFENLKRDVPDFPQKVKILDTIKNNQASLEQLIAQIEKISNVAGVKLPSMTPDQALAGSNQLSLNVSGDYAGIKRFMNGLENNQLIINVTDLNISGSDPDLVVTMKVKTGQ